MRTERYLIVGLVLSLIVNGVLAGMLVGRALPGDRPPPPVAPMLGMRMLPGDLPADREAALRPHYRRYLASLRPRFREIRSAQAALQEALLTEPLDRQALAEALDALSTELHETQNRARDALLDLAAALTLDERRSLLEELHVHRGERRSAADRPRLPPHTAPH